MRTFIALTPGGKFNTPQFILLYVTLKVQSLTCTLSFIFQIAAWTPIDKPSSFTLLNAFEISCSGVSWKWKKETSLERTGEISNLALFFWSSFTAALFRAPFKWASKRFAALDNQDKHVVSRELWFTCRGRNADQSLRLWDNRHQAFTHIPMLTDLFLALFRCYFWGYPAFELGVCIASSIPDMNGHRTKSQPCLLER